jgi:hypothetical protein
MKPSRNIRLPANPEDSISLDVFPSPQPEAPSTSGSHAEFAVARLLAETLSNAGSLRRNRNSDPSENYIQYFAQGASAAFQTIAKYPELVAGTGLLKRRNSDEDTQRDIDGKIDTNESRMLEKEGMCSR